VASVRRREARPVNGKSDRDEATHVPTTTADGVSLYYEAEGDGETVVFVGEAGLGAWQWAWWYNELTGPYKTVIWDLPGTGNSDVRPGSDDVDALASSLEAVLAAVDARRAHVVGAGLGGVVALRYAREYDRARTLGLFGTAPKGDAVDVGALEMLHAGDAIAAGDSEAVRESLTVGFSEAFLAEEDVVEQLCTWRLAEDADPSGFAAQLDALRAFEAGPLYELTVPTLVCHGLDDPVVDHEVGRRLADELPRGTFESVEGRHLCHLEHATAVADRFDAFMDEHTDDGR
jgi:3-oxoadipate enol-lactonase